MARILTGVIGSFLALAAVFVLPTPALGVLCALVFLGAVWEFVRIAKHWSPSAPLNLLLVAVPLAALALDAGISGRAVVFSAAAVMMAVVCALAVLLLRTSVAESLPAMGILCFGTLYFAAPLASVVEIHRRDPWLLVLALAIIWLGDAAALYGGRLLGKRKLSPVVSPNKTWAGAISSFLMALIVTFVWSLWHRGGIELEIFLLAALISVAGQVGDLVESMIKRGAGVKDSGSLLPGHGGVYDRIDALLFGAPAMLAGLFCLGL